MTNAGRTPTTVFKAIAPRLDDARANMLIVDPYTARDAVLYRTYLYRDSSRHIDFQFADYIPTRAQNL